MGLAAPKQRNKIGADPNNTQWAKSTDRFGHKILTSQGWKPGNTLGAENASHASHYTTASSSHIRVLLREDGLGLGAKNGRQEADKFGLDMFQGLLGRLNGKSEEVLEKEAGYRRDLNLREMVVKRFGGTTFVSGGYLVGDKIEKTVSSITTPAEVVAVISKDKRSKKRKRDEVADNSVTAEENKEAKISVQTTADSVAKKEKRKSKKEKKSRLSADGIPTIGTDDGEDSKYYPSEGGSQVDEVAREKELKRQRKAERKAAKEAKRLEKQERKRKKREVELKDEVATVSSTPVEASETETASETPSNGLQKTASVARGRFAVRSRYSQQKRLAVTDQQALKEIFMIKAGA